MLLALALALLTRGEPTYQFTSIYQQAETEPGEPITRSASVIQQLESLYWPSYQYDYKEINNLEAFPFGLEINNQNNTTLVILCSMATKDNQEKVVETHEELLEKIMLRQEKLLDKKREYINIVWNVYLQN